MTDVTTAWTAHETGLAYTEWWEIIVEHELTKVHTFKGLDPLLISTGAKGCCNNGLGLTTGEKS